MKQPVHIVLIGHDAEETSNVGLALARRIHRPFVDGTTPAETKHSGSAEASSGSSESQSEASSAAAVETALGCYERAVKTNDQTVIAVSAVVLDRAMAPPDESRTWVVWLDDPTNDSDVVTTEQRERASRLSHLRVETTGHDLDRIVERVVEQWHDIREMPRTEDES